jgi:programmed cell death 6-interacting protein
MLDDEERGDTDLRNQFKERWTRTVSSTLTVPLREEAKKYMDIIQNAINADKVVQEKYRMNRDCVVLLSKQTVIIFSIIFQHKKLASFILA